LSVKRSALPSAAMSSLGAQLRVGGVLAVQFAFQPFLTKWFVDPAALKSSVVLTCELVKVLACLVALAVTGEAKRTRWSPTEMLWCAGVPALTYTLQNLLVQTAYQNLDGMTFNVVNQTKILFNALFVYMIMGDGQSLVQMLALSMIFGASVMVSLGESSASASGAEDFALGVLCCFAGSALSGLGSAITELVLVRKQRNTLVFSAELSGMSAVSVALNLALDLTGDGRKARAQGLFFAWDAMTLVPVVTNSLGGLAVGAVTKYAGSVRKGFAITVGLVLSAALRVVVAGRPMTLAIAAAMLLASAGILLHVSQPRKRAPASKDKTG